MFRAPYSSPHTGHEVMTLGCHVGQDLVQLSEKAVDIVGADGMTVVGALATHYHPDHVGGSMMGFDIAGVAGLESSAVRHRPDLFERTPQALEIVAAGGR